MVTDLVPHLVIDSLVITTQVSSQIIGIWFGNPINYWLIYILFNNWIGNWLVLVLVTKLENDGLAVAYLIGGFISNQ